MQVIHVYPIDDLIEHELNETCICGPEIAAVEGTEDQIITHHSLDGRERLEDDYEGNIYNVEFDEDL